MRGLPQFILAEVSAEMAINSPADIKVGSSLLGEILIREHEQAKRSDHASVGCAAAGAAVVGDIGLDRGLQRLFVDLELSFYVQLEFRNKNQTNNSDPIQ